MSDETKNSAPKPRKTRKTVVGKVHSAKMEKSLTVRVEERIRHKRYGKFTRKFTTFRVHDETNQALEGDLVEIMETRPLSKTKRWRLVKILKKAVGSES